MRARGSREAYVAHMEKHKSTNIGHIGVVAHTMAIEKPYLAKCENSEDDDWGTQKKQYELHTNMNMVNGIPPSGCVCMCFTPCELGRF